MEDPVFVNEPVQVLGNPDPKAQTQDQGLPLQVGRLAVQVLNTLMNHRNPAPTSVRPLEGLRCQVEIHKQLSF